MSGKSKQLKNNLAARAKEITPPPQEIPEAPEEMVYKDEDPEEAASVATEAVEGLSVAPTEMLANEYNRLMNQYEEEQLKRRELEN